MTSPVASVTHDLEWVAQIEARFEGIPVTDDFGVALFTALAKLETRCRDLIQLRSAWNAHFRECASGPVITPEQLDEWRTAPSNTMSADPPDWLNDMDRKNIRG